MRRNVINLEIYANPFSTNPLPEKSVFYCENSNFPTRFLTIGLTYMFCSFKKLKRIFNKFARHYSHSSVIVTLSRDLYPFQVHKLCDCDTDTDMIFCTAPLGIITMLKWQNIDS